MRVRTLRSDLLLLAAAMIWGFAFVAQRLGMDHVGPFTFNAARFLLGTLSLLPLLYYFELRAGKPVSSHPADARVLLRGGLLAGVLLFCGASLQQVGLVYTTAGKAGFITGLYIIIVPILGLLWRYHTGVNTWVGAAFAIVGLYFLSVTEDFFLAYGDLLELIGAFFWAGHVLAIGWLAPRIPAIRFAITQFAVCTLLSLVTALLFERIEMASLAAVALPLGYAGVLSVGVAYTLQVVAQRDAPAAHAAIILSLEAVFAALGGWLLLQEILSWRAITGCGLMLLGMLISQLPILTRRGPLKARRPG